MKPEIPGPAWPGPDLRAGVPLDSLEDGAPLLGHADGEPVLLVRRGDDVLAVGATCTHYGGPLADGLITGDVVRCPWHHACFSLRTGEAVAAPALNPLPRWRTRVEDGVVRVDGKEEPSPLDPHGRVAGGPVSVVIVGAGAAGSAAAEMLRREGYAGPVTLVDPDAAAPYDRPNLSKDFLAGSAPEDWIPLRPSGFHAEHGIERREASAAGIDTDRRVVTLSNGETLGYGALLLATGAAAIRLPVPGADQPHVRVLRSLDDCRGIIDAAESARRVVIAGASFIGMEAAAALRARELDVTVVAPEQVPFAAVLGPELGGFLRALHERNGVRFHLGRTLAAVRPDGVVLDDGTAVDAGLVLLGVGVRPAVELAERAGLRTEDGILVDRFLATSAPGVYAAGDNARYPDPRSGERVRIEHWVVAQRQGQTAARNILGRGEPFESVPFFWTAQYDVRVSYVGHGVGWDRLEMDGDPASGDCRVAYLRGDSVVATATVGRDDESLRAERALERAKHG